MTKLKTLTEMTLAITEIMPRTLELAEILIVTLSVFAILVFICGITLHIIYNAVEVHPVVGLVTYLVVVLSLVILYDSQLLLEILPY